MIGVYWALALPLKLDLRDSYLREVCQWSGGSKALMRWYLCYGQAYRIVATG
ncbi:hypothetical protein [Photorhabdus antumapuensis]|uniref:hypothetical protein n=1 Tax=Photorhabdus antumapuensis TaxID=2862867 RepID=UPI001CEDC479|nr:hypothetical protein [Photorhabdus antumapuensis]MCA6221060.1 hypothetical protein [Photorhabdus antumapuensis]